VRLLRWQLSSGAGEILYEFPDVQKDWSRPMVARGWGENDQTCMLHYAKTVIRMERDKDEHFDT